MRRACWARGRPGRETRIATACFGAGAGASPLWLLTSDGAALDAARRSARSRGATAGDEARPPTGRLRHALLDRARARARQRARSDGVPNHPSRAPDVRAVTRLRGAMALVLELRPHARDRLGIAAHRWERRCGRRRPGSLHHHSAGHAQKLVRRAVVRIVPRNEKAVCERERRSLDVGVPRVGLLIARGGVAARLPHPLHRIPYRDRGCIGPALLIDEGERAARPHLHGLRDRPRSCGEEERRNRGTH
jgi:hypothetical protein